MIVRRNGAELLLVTQPDHAHLAADLIDRWSAREYAESPRRSEILLAVREHDNGWAEPDAAPIVDPASGALLDFTNAPTSIRRGVWPRGIERLAHTPYSAALVAQHAAHIYQRFHHDADWTPFFEEMTTRRDSHLARCPGTPLDTLLADYFFVRIADLMSLTFCNRWDKPQRHGDYSVRAEGDRVIVSPDPFDGRQIPISIAARRLPNRAFASADDARQAFENAPAVTLTGVAAGA